MSKSNELQDLRKEIQDQTIKNELKYGSPKRLFLQLDICVKERM